MGKEMDIIKMGINGMQEIGKKVNVMDMVFVIMKMEINGMKESIKMEKNMVKEHYMI